MSSVVNSTASVIDSNNIVPPIRVITDRIVPFIDRTSGFPSNDTVDFDNTKGFAVVFNATINNTGNPDFQFFLLLTDGANREQIQFLRRNGSNSLWMRVKVGNSFNTFPLDSFREECILDGENVTLGFSGIQEGSTAKVSFFIDGIRVAHVEGEFTLGTFTNLYTARSNGTGNNLAWTSNYMKAYNRYLTRAQMEELTDGINLGFTPIHARRELNMFLGNSNANGAGDIENLYTFANTVEQLGKDITNGVRALNSDEIIGDDPSAFGSLWTTSNNGYSGLGALCDLYETQRGVDQVAVPMGQGGLTLTVVPGENNFNANDSEGQGNFFNPRTVAVIKTLKLMKKLGTKSRVVLINGHNDAAQSVTGTDYENDMNFLFEALEYYAPEAQLYMVTNQNWTSAFLSLAGGSIPEADWNAIKSVQDSYVRNGVTVVDGSDYALNVGDEIHLSEDGQIDMAYDIAGETRP